MDSTTITWVMEHTNQLSVAVLLAIAILAFGRGWVVPGWIYRATVAERDALRAASDRATETLKLQNEALSQRLREGDYDVGRRRR